MCKLFNQWETEIEKYCTENNLNFEKAKKMGKSWGKDDIALQYNDPEKGLKGLLDETPAPVVLWIRKNSDHLEFEQTEYTKKYLAS